MKQVFSRYWQFVLAHKVGFISGAIGVVVLGALGGFILIAQPHFNLNIPNTRVGITAPAPTPPKFYSPLTGLEVANEAATKQEVRGVMIENSPQARPQSGLKQAGVVFEADADGGITRFLVLYQEAKPGLIGPVRSLRPYFVDWLAAFDTTISHVGGSAAALQTIRNGSFKDLDEFFNGSYYYRSTDRYAPHNVYTTSDKLIALSNAKGYTSSTFTGFPRKAEAPSAAPNAGSIDINVSYDPYNVHYDYDKPTNSYVRFESGVKHVDREEGQIAPKVVIVIKVPTKVALEDGYRVDMQSTGSGDAYVFQDGTVTQGSWAKPDAKTQISFVDASGKPILLDPGQTWITVIAPEKVVTWR
ncbi:MAG TPA: DUF3048 domain-containing protein [Candidatus Acidoferrum sp.]|nr:DUF3048 domain-containing protein [Candidatus Acidoferrum sp.]